MDKKIELDKIVVLLKGWLTEIQFNTKLDYYDINRISEGLSAKLLNAVFNYKLEDLNKIKKNYPGIDLGDNSSNKIAFQITSRSDFSKFKENIETFVKKDQNGKCLADTFTNGIKFLVISIKEIKKGKTNLSSIYPGFDLQTDILRVEDLLPYISDLYDTDKARFSLVKQILEDQFSNKENNKFTSIKKDQFLKEYSKIIKNNFSRINFFGLDLPKKPREIQLYSLFVEPTFKPFKDNLNNYKTYFDHEIKETEIINKIDISQLSSDLFSFKQSKDSIINIKDFSPLNFHALNKYRLDFSSFYSRQEQVITYKNLFNNKRSKVIIGNPGAGKSLLVKQAICKILSPNKEQFKSNFIFETLPFRIELFKFNKDRKNKGIEHYLFTQLKHTLEIQWITEEHVSDILNKNQTIIFFDGLDEIFDVQDRLEVRDLIENFTAKYNNSISIVTSRFESYEEVNLNNTTFDTIQILDFNESQIKEYVNKWYFIEEENDYSRPSEIRNCLEQLSRVDTELKTSPLLLSLILILYRNELDIPTTKLEIYESCANTLIETRDVKEKKLDLNFQIRNKASAFAHIAFWQFNLQNGDGKKKEINYSSVAKELKQYLLQQKNTPFEDDFSAMSAVKEFLEYANNRSIYVENNFTHKSFLEYFTAYYLHANYYYKGEHDYIHNIISNNIDKSSWFVVLELLICKIDTGQPDYDIIDNIIEKQIVNNEIHAIVFFMQILAHIRNVSNITINNIISKAISIMIEERSDNSTSVIDNFINLAKSQRFQPAIQRQFCELINNTSEIYSSRYAIINLEANITSETENVLGVKHQFGAIQDPYITILESYPNLLNWTNYFESLKHFISIYSNSQVTNTYNSLSRSKIFYGESHFNWILSCLFSFNDKKQFLRNYGKLRLLGFKANDIYQVVKNTKNTFEIPQEILNSYFGVKDYSINNLLNQISKNRYNTPHKKQFSNKTFHEKKNYKRNKFY